MLKNEEKKGPPSFLSRLAIFTWYDLESFEIPMTSPSKGFVSSSSVSSNGRLKTSVRPRLASVYYYFISVLVGLWLLHLRIN